MVTKSFIKTQRQPLIIIFYFSSFYQKQNVLIINKQNKRRMRGPPHEIQETDQSTKKLHYKRGAIQKSLV